MELFYVIVIIILIIIFTTVLSKEKRKILGLTQMIEQTRREASAAISTQQQDFIREKELMIPKGLAERVMMRFQQEQNEKLKKIESDFRKSTSEYEDKVDKMRSYIHSLERQSRNFGEIATHKILTDLKYELISEGTINADQMIIIPNVFIPVDNVNGEVSARQIDHVVLTVKGIFIIETKYWRGNILHGITMKESKDFSFILKNIYPKISMDTERTLVFINDVNKDADSNKKEMRIVSYEDPATQVKGAALSLNKLLGNYDVNVFINPIIYFGYNDKYFKNYSTATKPYVFDKKEQLCTFFRNIFITENNIEISPEQLREIKKIIDRVNYISN